MKKIEKHEGILRTPQSSLNTVESLVSKALEDDVISPEEFGHILRELDNYKSHKTGIKHRARADLIELTSERERQIRAEAEQAGIEKGKKEAMDTLLSTVKTRN